MADGVVVELELENFLGSLFGSHSFHGLAGEVRFGRRRDAVVRVVKNLRRSATFTLNTDEGHLRDILQACDDAIAQLSSADTPQQASNRAIMGLTRIAFLLIGEYPDHFFEKQPTHDNYWVLNGERQIGYTQSAGQKARVLLNLEKRGLLGGDLQKKPFSQQYHLLKGNAADFLAWVKKNHPEVYLRYF